MSLNDFTPNFIFSYLPPLPFTSVLIAKLNALIEIILPNWADLLCCDRLPVQQTPPPLIYLYACAKYASKRPVKHAYNDNKLEQIIIHDSLIKQMLYGVMESWGKLSRAEPSPPEVLARCSPHERNNFSTTHYHCENSSFLKVPLRGKQL